MSRLGFYLDCGDSEPTNRVDALAQSQLGERCERRFDHVGMIIGTQGLCEHIADSSRFDYGTDATTCNHSGSRGSGSQKDSSSAVFTSDFMRDSILPNRDLDERLLRGLTSLPNSLGNLVGFSKAAANLTFAVAGYDQGTEAEAAATLYDLGAPIDKDNLLGESGFVLPSPVIIAISAIIGCWHGPNWLEK